MVRALLVALGVAVLVPSAGASTKTGFAFGRFGGSIRPYTVVISTGGTVRTSCPVQVRHVQLSRIQLGELNKLAATSAFATMPKATTCPGVLPDVASTFIRVGPRRVAVHGSCAKDYQQLWKALVQAVRLVQS